MTAHVMRVPRRTERADTTLGPAGRAILLAACLVAAACEYPGVPHPLATTEHDGALSLFADAGGGFAIGGGSGGAAGEGAAEPKATVHFKDFQLDPDSLRVAAGTVRFTLMNEGRYTHDFRIEGSGIDDRSPRIGAGRTIEWGLALPAGEYKISCPISNHADRGMTGKLVVVGR